MRSGGSSWGLVQGSVVSSVPSLPLSLCYAILVLPSIHKVASSSQEGCCSSNSLPHPVLGRKREKGVSVRGEENQCCQLSSLIFEDLSHERHWMTSLSPSWLQFTDMATTRQGGSTVQGSPSLSLSFFLSWALAAPDKLVRKKENRY